MCMLSFSYSAFFFHIPHVSIGFMSFTALKQWGCWLLTLLISLPNELLVSTYISHHQLSSSPFSYVIWKGKKQDSRVIFSVTPSLFFFSWLSEESEIQIISESPSLELPDRTMGSKERIGKLLFVPLKLFPSSLFLLWVSIFGSSEILSCSL